MHTMPARDATALLRLLEAHDAQVCVGGGWAVDALLGEQTREHSDLDLWAPAVRLEALFAALVEAGVDRVYPWPGDRPWNFVLHDGAHRRVDLHLYETRPDGTLYYGPALDGFTFPAAALAGRGRIADLEVPCEAPEWSLQWHTGYPPRAADRHDVPRLCQRFNLPVPETFSD